MNIILFHQRFPQNLLRHIRLPVGFKHPSNLPGSLVYARKFTARRNADHEAVKMNRLYAVESSPSLTGAMADHRLALKASEVAGFALAVAHEVGVNADGAAFAGKKSWIAAVARDLKKHRGRCLVVAGEYQSPEVHYLAHALNAALGNVGKTVFYTRSVEANPVLQADSIAELANDMAAGAVDLLVIVGGNPVFDAPANLDFSEKMAQVKMRVHLNLYEDETSNLCHWHVPESHALENWSDARAFTFDGTATIIQPLIAPLYGSQSAHELLAAIHDEVGKSGHDIVREFWAEQAAPQDFEKFWRVSLHDGVVAGTSFSTKSVKMRGNVELQISKSRTDSGLEVIFRPDPNIWDGRFANNGWLQELPRPLTKLTWDNAALVSPATAEQLGVSNEEVISISVGDRSVAAPVWILPGHVDGALTLNFGFGRTHVGQVGKGAGLNVYPLRTSGKAWMATGAQITKTGDRVELAGTQDHSSMEGRDIVRSASLKDYVEHPEMFYEMGHDPPPELSLYPAYEYNGYAWGIVVDLNTCIGCNACTIACQSENNISVVGKEQVLNGREMHWIRIDRYYEGDLDNPETYHQPVMCQHCENAPCEVVCPVAATTHSKEGLNEMTYNRCVGTRYCANNCPYKVRRFNFFLYADLETESLKLMRNPDVTVRTRGIMEKCTYCVQRINVARIEAKKEGRNIRDGEIVTACQQVCPADAIVFGDINDSESRVSRLKAGHRNYGILSELGVRPRTSYLAKIKNPNPEIVAA